MIKHKKALLSVVAAMLVAGTTILIGSCSKEGDYSQSGSYFQKSLTAEAIPEYSSLEEVFEVISMANSFDTLSDLLYYEASQGRNSIGAISDMFYEGIEIENFSNEEDALTFCTENLHLLDTVIKDNETYVYPKWYNHPYRYVANQNGLFKVNDDVYRLLKNSIVSTSVSNLSALLVINDKDVETLDTSIFKVSKRIILNINPHASCSDNVAYGGSMINNNSRFTMELAMNYLSGSGFPVVTVTIEASNHTRYLGIWWTARHNVTIDANAVLHKIYPGNGWVNIPISKSISKKFNSKSFVIFEDYFVVTDNLSLGGYHFKSFCIKGRNPSVDELILQWN